MGLSSTCHPVGKYRGIKPLNHVICYFTERFLEYIVGGVVLSKNFVKHVLLVFSLRVILEGFVWVLQ